MRTLKFFLSSVLILIFVSLLFQVRFSTDDLVYHSIGIGGSEYGGVYSPSAASVEVSLSCSNKTQVFVRDVEENIPIYTITVYGSDLVPMIFPHPGHYEFSLNSTEAHCSIIIKPIEVGFPTENWNAHFILGSLTALSLAFLIWRDGR